LEIIDKLNKEINVALVEPKIKARLADLGAAALAGSPADFGKLISEEAEQWGKVIRAANIKPGGGSLGRRGVRWHNYGETRCSEDAHRRAEKINDRHRGLTFSITQRLSNVTFMPRLTL